VKDTAGLGAAASANDELAETEGMQAAVAAAGLDFAELMYVAEQRALRAVVLQFRGQAALEALKDDPIVALGHTERAAQMLYMGMYLDGITIGYRAYDRNVASKVEAVADAIEGAVDDEGADSWVKELRGIARRDV
jgi:hypothetical protein